MKPHSSPSARARTSTEDGDSESTGARGRKVKVGRAETRDKAEAGGDKSERGGDKRERILDAAERVFAARGFYQARVSEIARDAGVADGTIYLYFKSKDDLLISLFESRMERVNAVLAAAVAGLETPTEKLTALIRTHLELVKRKPEVAEVLTIELRQSSKFMKEYASPRFGEFLKLMASVIAEGQARGEMSAQVPPPQAARMLFGIVDELALAWLLGGNEHVDIDQAADWVCALIMDGLKPRPQARYDGAPPTASAQERPEE
ncbi:TetR/AcrR family transcriptional regulator [Haliangium sp.]|uniref:TetR/AcrR family transcriptional regulator n=1 Tax=Haliangium sp. TaxID=2663208 RepID=UPI003D1050F7